MADGNIYSGKTGSPRISLTLNREDHDHLIKFVRFLSCSYQISSKKTVLNGKVIVQYTLRFSSKHIAETLANFGVIPKKSLIAKVNGLQGNSHFWRGVFDGDGYLLNRNGNDGDKMILTGCDNLLQQFRRFVEKNAIAADIRIRPYGKYSRLFIYSRTARTVAKLLYGECTIALDRKYVKAVQMSGDL